MRANATNRTKTLLALGAVTALLAVPAVPALAGPGHEASKGSSNGKQTICHATHSNTNPYVVNTPNKNGDVSGHAKHTGPVWTPELKKQKVAWGDIVPSFTYNDHGTTKTFPGLNWDANGQAWFANSCRVPITMTVVKSNDANGDATFSDSETATSVGAAVPFQVVVTNTSVVPAVVSSFVDKVGSTEVPITPTPDIVGTTLAAGQSVTVTFTVAGYTPADGTSKVDEVSVAMHEVGDTTNGGSGSDTSTVLTVVPRDVSIVKTGPATVTPGDTLTYSLAVTNDSVGVPVSGVAVTESLPDGTTFSSFAGDGWTKDAGSLTFHLTGDLAVGATSTFTVTLTLDAAYTGATVVNTAVVTPTDATPADNSDTWTTTVQRRDVSVVKTGPAAAVAPGDTFSWTLRVTNDGPLAVPGVVVTDTLPADVTLVSTSTSAAWTTATSGQTLTFTHVGDLAVGAPDPADDITITVTLSAAYALPTISNTAVVAPDDLTPADNTSTVTTDVTTGGGGTIVTPTPTTGGGGTFTGGGGGTTNLPRTGGPIAFLLAGALALMLTGLGVMLLSPRGKHS